MCLLCLCFYASLNRLVIPPVLQYSSTDYTDYNLVLEACTPTQFDNSILSLHSLSEAQIELHQFIKKKARLMELYNINGPLDILFLKNFKTCSKLLVANSSWTRDSPYFMQPEEYSTHPEPVESTPHSHALFP